MKKRAILVAIAMTTCLGGLASAFNDIGEADWYYREVLELSRRGIVKGYEDGTFRAENKVKSAEALTMVLRSIGKGEGGSTSGSNWADGIISTGVSEGIIEGDKFEGEREATREEVAEMIVKALKIENKEVEQDVFIDSSSKYANILYAEGIVNGEVIDGEAYFNPHRSISRAEMGALTIRVLDSRDSVGGNLPVGDSTEEKYFEFKKDTATITGYSKDGPKSVIIPKKIGGIDVLKVGERAFAGDDLVSLVIPEGIRSIEKYAFAGNNIVNLELATSIESIDSYAFTGNKLRSLNLPSSISNISSFAFAHNRLNTLAIPYGVEAIDSYAFASNEIEEISVASSVKSIARGALIGNNISNLQLPLGLTSIGEYAFENNKIKKLAIPDTVWGIGNSAFANNGLVEEDVSLGSGFREFWLYNQYDRTKVRGHILGGNNGRLEIPSGTRAIEKNSFVGNRLEELSIPDGVVTIEEGAFYNNKLAEMSFPKSISTIGSGAFKENSLSRVELSEQTSIVEEGDMSTFDKDTEISRY